MTISIIVCAVGVICLLSALLLYRQANRMWTDASKRLDKAIELHNKSEAQLANARRIMNGNQQD